MRVVVLDAPVVASHEQDVGDDHHSDDGVEGACVDEPVEQHPKFRQELRQQAGYNSPGGAR